jgi:hypothetical protein
MIFTWPREYLPFPLNYGYQLRYYQNKPIFVPEFVFVKYIAAAEGIEMRPDNPA